LVEYIQLHTAPDQAWVGVAR